METYTAGHIRGKLAAEAAPFSRTNSVVSEKGLKPEHCLNVPSYALPRKFRRVNNPLTFKPFLRGICASKQEDSIVVGPADMRRPLLTEIHISFDKPSQLLNPFPTCPAVAGAYCTEKISTQGAFRNSTD